MLQLETWKHVGLAALIAAILMLILMGGRVGQPYATDNIDRASNPGGFWTWFAFLALGGMGLAWALMTGRLHLG